MRIIRRHSEYVLITARDKRFPYYWLKDRSRPGEKAVKEDYLFLVGFKELAHAIDYGKREGYIPDLDDQGFL